MIQTASITDLRFKTKDVLERSKDMVWILHHGKPAALILSAETGNQILTRAGIMGARWNARERSIDSASEILRNIKKHQVKGPKNMSLTIDETLYGK